MKKIKTIQRSFLVCLAFTLTCCESFTEVGMPETQLAGSVAFSDKATANAALADIYARMRDEGMVSGSFDGLSSILGNYADELDFYGESLEIMSLNNHTVLPSNEIIGGIWIRSYGQIFAANALLEGLEMSPAITGEDRDRLHGEALFIRAFTHFYLSELFGDVPYVTSTNYTVNAVIGKLSNAEVRNNVIADLEEAKGLLPDSYPTEDRVRANKAVVTAMLSRVYLYNENWNLAAENADAVINNPLYIWEENPENVFLKDSPAIIWSLHPGFAGRNTQDAGTWIFSYGPPFKSSMSEDLINAFESGDLRRQHWTRTITDGADSWYHAYKYKKILATSPSQEYTIVLRLAELYLIRSEARAHMGDLSGSVSDLDKVRNRAGLSNTVAVSQSELIDAIIRERRVELFCEQGHRWFDLKRTGRADSVLGAVKPNWQSTHVLLPLPESELLLNGNLLPQNAGY